MSDSREGELKKEACQPPVVRCENPALPAKKPTRSRSTSRRCLPPYSGVAGIEHDKVEQMLSSVDGVNASSSTARRSSPPKVRQFQVTKSNAPRQLPVRAPVRQEESAKRAKLLESGLTSLCSSLVLNELNPATRALRLQLLQHNPPPESKNHKRAKACQCHLPRSQDPKNAQR